MSDDGKPVVCKSELYHRLLDADLWVEAQEVRKAIRARLRSEGVPREEANERSWVELDKVYPPISHPAPEPAEPLPPGEHYPDADGDYLAVMDWCCRALGRTDEGQRMHRLDAPGPKSWAVYCWAATDTKSRKEFFALWTAANRRESAGEDDSVAAETTRRQMAEIESMLAELRQ